MVSYVCYNKRSGTSDHKPSCPSHCGHQEPFLWFGARNTTSNWFWAATYSFLWFILDQIFRASWVSLYIFSHAWNLEDRGFKSRGEGVLHHIFVSRVQHLKKNWTQSDQSFCENEGSKRSKINQKVGQLDWKSRWKFIQNA